MKERTFYTINLDVTRIFILLAIFFGFLAYFFFLGRSTASKDKQAVQKIVSEPKETKPEVKDVSSPEEKMSGTDLPKEKGTETIELKTKTDPAKDTPAVVEVKEDSAKTLPQPKAELTKTIAPAKQINRRYYKKKKFKKRKPIE